MTSNDGSTKGPRRFRFGIRSMFVAIPVLAVLFAGYGWLDWRIGEPRRRSAAVQRQLESLVSRRPNNMSPRQWESAVAWTLNLHGNSLMLYQAKGTKIRNFDERLAKKLAGEVNMDTIHWIWDEYADICPGGANYQRFRSQMDDEIAQGGGDWGLNVP